MCSGRFDPGNSHIDHRRAIAAHLHIDWSLSGSNCSSSLLVAGERGWTHQASSWEGDPGKKKGEEMKIAEVFSFGYDNRGDRGHDRNGWDHHRDGSDHHRRDRDHDWNGWDHRGYGSSWDHHGC